MPSRNQWDWRWFCASEHLGALWESPWQRTWVGRDVFLFLSGAEVTKPSTMEINSDLNPQKQEIQDAGEEQERAPGMGSVQTPLIWISCLCGFVIPPNYCFKNIFACNFTTEMCSLFLFCWLLFLCEEKNYIKTYMWSTIVFLATPQDRIKYKFNK